MTLEELLRQGKSFGQGASNSAASTVTGPVDMLAWLLRKGGVPVGDTPIGGEAWMRQKGLMATPENKLAGLLGEGAGLAAPIVAAAKAPEIAGGLLQMGRNLATPQTMNKQTGAIVYHGSPHKFDKFDSSKIGTGEGAQAYGHGLYLAESPDVAGSYVQSVKANSSELASRGKVHGLPDDVSSNLIAALQSGKKFDPLMDSARKMINDPLAGSAQRQAAQRLLDNEMPAYNAWSEWSKPGSLYKVDLPDDQIAKMLDWDKPLSQQHPDVQSVLLKHPDVLDQIQKAEAQRVLLNERSPMRLDKIPSASIPYDASRMAGKDALTAIQQRSGLGVTGGVEQQLRRAGIPGIRYLDGGSRGAGQGSSNFVVFPGNEGLLKILERNGGKP